MIKTKKIILTALASLAILNTYAQGTIVLEYRNKTVLNGGTGFAFDVWASGAGDYVAPDNVWTAMNIRMDVTMPAGVTISGGTTTPNPTYADATGGLQTSVPGTPPAGSQEFGISLTRLGGQTDMSSTPVRLASVVVNVTGGTISEANIATPRTGTTTSGSFWTNAAAATRRSLSQPANFPLPCTLLSFTAKKVDNRVQLNWHTATEQNTDYFEVERSADGRAFDVSVRRMKAAGVSNTSLEYQTYDLEPQKGANYYRLKTVDRNGATTLSQVCYVVFGDKTMYSISPNPATDHIVVKGLEDGSSIQVKSGTGHLVATVKATNAAETISLAALANGVYYVQIIRDGSIVYTEKIVKQ